MRDDQGIIKGLEIRFQIKLDPHGRAARMCGTGYNVTDPLKLRQSLEPQNNILQMMLNSMSEGVVVCNADSQLILANESARQMLNTNVTLAGIPQLAGRYQWLPPDGHVPCEYAQSPLAHALGGENTPDFEVIIKCQRTNVDRIMNCSSTPLWNTDRTIFGAVKVLQDVTASKTALQELRKAEQHFKLLVEGTTNYAIFMLDTNGNIASWNPGAQRILGYDEKEVIGRHMSLFYMAAAIAQGEPQRKLNQEITEGRAEEDNWRVRKEGRRFRSTAVLGALHDKDGGVCGFVEIMRDNTDRRLAEENTYSLANHDSLTGLANRTRFMERLHEALINANRDNTQVAVLLLDLDRFKLINDTIGHQVGDLLLKKVSLRLQKCVRETDTVARLGGDEFVVILTRLKEMSSVEILAEKIVQEMSRPYHINRHKIRSGTSIGVAVYRQDGNDPGELLQKADLAMYRAKSSGRNRYRVFAPSMLTEMRVRREQESSLQHALDYQEFELAFQPQVDLRTLRVSGAEVLVRNKNRVLQNVPASKVIALAEETGWIIPLGEWILQIACRQMRKWQKAGLPNFKVAINFSPMHLLAPNFVETVNFVLTHTGLDASHLEVEVTEGILVAASKDNDKVMTLLKELGVPISVDNFGTGYSALSYLKNFPADVLKIDGSLVRNLPEDQDDAAIVSAIIRLTLDLNLKIVAEGVETAEQLVYLRSTNCNMAQGFLFSPPVKTEEFESLLHNPKWTTPILR